MLGPFLCGHISVAPLIPKLRGHFAEFLNNASSVGLRILSSSTCVGLRYGPVYNYSGFSRRCLHQLPYPCVRSASCSAITWGICLPSRSAFAPVLPSPALTLTPRPHSSVYTGYRNLNLLSIDYASQPRLRPRLTQGRSALPWKPWIFGRKDSHLTLATHSGILPSIRSTTPYGMASPHMECSPTNPYRIPQLRCSVLAPDIFGAGPLG